MVALFGGAGGPVGKVDLLAESTLVEAGFESLEPVSLPVHSHSSCFWMGVWLASFLLQPFVAVPSVPLRMPSLAPLAKISSLF